MDYSLFPLFQAGSKQNLNNNQVGKKGNVSSAAAVLQSSSLSSELSRIDLSPDWRSVTSFCNEKKKRHHLHVNWFCCVTKPGVSRVSITSNRATNGLTDYPTCNKTSARPASSHLTRPCSPNMKENSLHLNNHNFKLFHFSNFNLTRKLMNISGSHDDLHISYLHQVFDVAGVATDGGTGSSRGRWRWPAPQVTVRWSAEPWAPRSMSLSNKHKKMTRWNVVGTWETAKSPFPSRISSVYFFNR